MKLRQITPEFVDEISRELDPGKLYVCGRYRAVKHLVCVRLRRRDQHPLHPTGWTLICDGVSVSLWPSIGNWSEKCQSHYWIRNNKIHWASKWSRRKILKTRKARDLELKQYFSANAYPETNHSMPKALRWPLSLRGWAHTTLRLHHAPQIAYPLRCLASNRSPDL